MKHDYDTDHARRWVRAFSALTGAFANPEAEVDDEEAASLCVEFACRGAAAHGAIIFLDSIGGALLCEAAVVCGPAAPDPDDGSCVGLTKITSALGLEFTAHPSVISELDKGRGIAFENPLREPNARSDWHDIVGVNGPVLYVPIMAGHLTLGCLVLWRKPSGNQFLKQDTMSGAAFGAQVAMVLGLLGSQRTATTELLSDERNRIARDLHDLAIQGIFATGMKLGALREGLRTGKPVRHLESMIEEAESDLEESIMQIRNIVDQLKDEIGANGLADQLGRETSTARSHLGFAPTLVLEIDDYSVPASTDNRIGFGGSRQDQSDPPEPLVEEFDARVNHELAADITAVVREALSNVARHAGASSVLVNIGIHGKGRTGEVVVSVIDDGKGIDPSRTRNSGLSNMQRRAVLRGGNFGVGAGPRRRGTSLVWRAPLM